MTLLKELGVRLVAYIDDVLVLAETAGRARDHTTGLIYLLENLGFLVHPKKKKNSARANSGDRILRNDARFEDERTAPTWPEIEEDKAGD